MHHRGWRSGRHQADRRAVGRGGTVPGGRVPRSAGAGANGTAATATTSAASGGATRAYRRSGLAHVRQLRPLPVERPPAAALGQLRHLPRWLHALRSRQLQRETQRRQRRRQPRRTNENFSWNCGVEGPTDRPRGARSAAAAGQKPHDDSPAFAGRADDPGRGRVPPHAAGQQQRLVPGQRAILGELGSG